MSIIAHLLLDTTYYKRTIQESIHKTLLNNLQDHLQNHNSTPTTQDPGFQKTVSLQTCFIKSRHFKCENSKHQSGRAWNKLSKTTSPIILSSKSRELCPKYSNCRAGKTVSSFSLKLLFLNPSYQHNFHTTKSSTACHNNNHNTTTSTTHHHHQNRLPYQQQRGPKSNNKSDKATTTTPTTTTSTRATTRTTWSTTKATLKHQP